MAESFVFYKSFFDGISALPAEAQAKSYETICKYALFGEEPSPGGLEYVIFVMAKAQIDANNKKREAGKKGGEANGKQTEAEPKQNEAKAKQNEAQAKKNEANVNVNANVNANVNENVNENVNANANANANENDNTIVRPEDGRPSESVLTEEFNREIWDLYPRSRRNGKKKALASYIRDRKNGADKTEVILGINRYRAYITATHLEEKYIKQADTFFNQSAWQDAWEPPRGSVDHRYDDIKAWLDGKEASG